MIVETMDNCFFTLKNRHIHLPYDKLASVRGKTRIRIHFGTLENPLFTEYQNTREEVLLPKQTSLARIPPLNALHGFVTKKSALILGCIQKFGNGTFGGGTFREVTHGESVRLLKTTSGDSVWKILQIKFHKKLY